MNDVELFRKISEIIKDQEVYVVGGYVRDKYLNRQNHDLDLSCSGSGIELAKKLGDAFSVEAKLFPSFGTAHLNIENFDIDICGFRKENYERGSRNPVIEDGTLEDDYRRRDYTVNAIYLSLSNKNFLSIIDPLGGVEDIKNKEIRAVQDPIKMLQDDPLRIYRGIRLAVQLGFSIEQKTFEAMTACKDDTIYLAQERVTEELNKIMSSSNPARGINILHEAGILNLVLPELSNLDISEGGHKNNYIHSLKVLDKIKDKTDNLWLRWAALLHDIGKSSTAEIIDGVWTFHHHEEAGAIMVEDIFRRLKQPLKEMEYVQLLVKLHMRPTLFLTDVATDSALRRLINDSCGNIEDLMLLSSCDTSTDKQNLLNKLDKHYNKLNCMIADLVDKDKKRLFRPLINGFEIMEILGIPPGNLITEIKDKAKELIMDGKLENNNEELKEWVRKNYKGKV